MRNRTRLLLLALAIFLLAGFGCAGRQAGKTSAQAPATAAEAPNPALVKPAQTPDFFFHDIVDTGYVKQFVKMPKPEGVLLIDSRPYKTKHVQGYIPTSVSLPDSEFEARAAEVLPKDKNALLIFYCEGYTCKLSHKSAARAEQLGYKNVKVYAGGYPVWAAEGNITAIGVEELKAWKDENKAFGLYDARPFKTKYVEGSIPGAVSLPDSEFAARKGLLPADKAAPLVFFCEGFTCKLSLNSAEKAAGLGYSKLYVCEAGYPGWKQMFGAGDAVKVSAGSQEGSIDPAQFEKIVAEKPDSIVIVDVRDMDEYAAGHFKTAVNIPVDQLEKRIMELPAGKPVVFVCSTGARSGEAYWMAKDKRPELTDVHYLDANVTYEKDGVCKVHANK